MDPVTNIIRLLTYAGLIPLVLLNILSLYIPGPWSQWMVYYGAVILSFIAGMQWGISIELERSLWVLIFSIACSLLAWASLLLPDITYTFICQLIGFFFLYLIDFKLIPEDAYPVQYLITRKRATLIFVLMLVLQLYIQSIK
ncbi:MAG: DUF3429 domain-containing protein [Gammaproteobacteria bacterium]|nr:DUF3429 domain-containing protein [Gammaproteobacteria bacterium]